MFINTTATQPNCSTRAVSQAFTDLPTSISDLKNSVRMLQGAAAKPDRNLMDSIAYSEMLRKKCNRRYFAKIQEGIDLIESIGIASQEADQNSRIVLSDVELPREGIDTYRAMRTAEFEGATMGDDHEFALVKDLLKLAA